MLHSFNPKFAKQYGIEEAVVFNDLRYWCFHNMKNNLNEKEFNGKKYFWTFNSCAALAEKYEYMSAAKIRRVLVSLEEHGLIISGSFNQNAYDRTKWYAVTEKGDEEYLKFEEQSEESIFQKCKMEVTESSNRFCTDVRPIPNHNTDTNTNHNTTTTSSSQSPNNIGSDFPLEEPINPFSDSSSNKEEVEVVTKVTPSKKSRKPRAKKLGTFSNDDYSACFEIISNNKKNLTERGESITSETYPIQTLKVMLKRCFTLYGVEDTKKGLKNSVNNSWLVKTARYSMSALFAQTMFPKYIADDSGNNKPGFNKQTAFSAKTEMNYGENGEVVF